VLISRGWLVDYVAIRSQITLLVPESGERNLVVLAAARLGKTRLIDNIEVCL
jgi:pantoate--beta-alanine ligase